MGRGTGPWREALDSKFQGFQSYVGESLSTISQAIEHGQRALKTGLLHSRDSANIEIIDVSQGLASWRKNSAWVDEKPIMEVSVPAGSLCQLNSTFKVGLPPLAVFDILIDPENKRVFKDIQEVRHRKVLEDHGHRQVVELEQAAIWRFLWLSGVLSVFVRVTQDRKALSVQYELGKRGFMKRFEGSWYIEPLHIDAEESAGGGRVASLVRLQQVQYELGKRGFMKRFEGSWYIEPLHIDAEESAGGGRVASLVRLQQVVELALMPPPPLSWYVRGITTKTTERLLEDLQAEGKRLREEGLQIESKTKEMEEWDAGSGKQSTIFHRYAKVPLGGRVLNRRTKRKRSRQVTV